jgi:DNA-directed RNA polymerase subunit RPC12/RpoP
LEINYVLFSPIRDGSRTFITAAASQAFMPKVELEYKCRKCKNFYPATVNFSGKIEDLDLDENQSRCPFCGEWNCADPKSIEHAMKESKK